MNEWWNLIDLAPHKIASLRYPSLTATERDAMLATFMTQTGEDSTPANPVISAEQQRRLQQCRPISLEPVRDLLTYLDLAGFCPYLRIPAEPRDQQALLNAESVVAERVIEYENKDDETRAEVDRRLQSIYTYLRGAASPGILTPFAQGVPVDLVIIPGCRGVGMRLRVVRGVEVLTAAAPRPRIILSGWQPYYAAQFDPSRSARRDLPAPLPFGEAEAMATVAETLLPGLLAETVSTAAGEAPRVVIDPRARNTVETIVHAIPVINEIRSTLCRPVSICLVTSPYHVRRLHAITMHHFEHFLDVSQVIGTVSVAAASSGVDLPQLLEPGDPRHRYAVELYVRESFKLLGGRMTGEF